MSIFILDDVIDAGVQARFYCRRRHGTRGT